MKSPKILFSCLFALILNIFAGYAFAGDEPSVYFVTPVDGETVSTPLKIVFGLSGMGVAPAGIDKANTGHHHLLIDTAVPEDLSKPILADDNHRHFGGGQTEAVIELSPGKHTLQLLLADFSHIPHKPPVMSQQITIMVE